MQPKWQRWKWTLLTVALAMTGISALIAHPDAFSRMGVFSLKPIFLDLRAVLAAGEGHLRGIDVYQDNPLDPLNRPHVYGPLWLLLGRLGLVTEDAWWVGALLVGGFVAVASFLVAPRTLPMAIGTASLLLCPPMLLGIERANNDLIIFLLLTLGAIGLGRDDRVGTVLAWAALTLAAVLKFYPLVCLGALLMLSGGLRRSGRWIVLGAVVFAAMWYLHRIEIARVLGVTPQPRSIFSYGIRVPVLAWKLLVGERAWLVAAALPALMAGAAWLWRARAELAETIAPAGWRTGAALIGGLAWVFCYLAALNYAYRAVLFFLIWPVLFAGNASRSARQLGWLMGIMVWLAWPTFQMAVLVEEANWTTWRVHVLAVLATVVHVVVLVVTVAIAWMLWSWLRRQWQSGALAWKS